MTCRLLYFCLEECVECRMFLFFCIVFHIQLHVKSIHPNKEHNTCLFQFLNHSFPHKLFSSDGTLWWTHREPAAWTQHTYSESTSVPCATAAAAARRQVQSSSCARAGRSHRLNTTVKHTPNTFCTGRNLTAPVRRRQATAAASVHKCLVG